MLGRGYRKVHTTQYERLRRGARAALKNSYFSGDCFARAVDCLITFQRQRRA